MAFKLESDWPRLSETLHYYHPDRCAACNVGPTPDLQLWQEHSRIDEPQVRYVILCRACSDKIVDPHPRLYRQISRNTPAPGAMMICADCTKRTRLHCPVAKANGGPGMTIIADQPLTAFMDGADSKGRRRGWVAKLYSRPPSNCSAKTT